MQGVRNQEATVARTSWFDEKAEYPIIQEEVTKLKSFTDAMADGVVEKKELTSQEQRLVAAMQRLEPELSDELHDRVTTVLIELSAYNIMRLLHELHAQHARMAFEER
jgi:hypothetical protein